MIRSASGPRRPGATATAGCWPTPRDSTRRRSWHNARWWTWPLLVGLFFGILVSQMIPFNLLIVSLFFIIIQLGLKETYWGAIIPLAASPIGLFFMRTNRYE